MPARNEYDVWNRALEDLQVLPEDLREAHQEILRLRDEVIGLHAIAGTLRGEMELWMAKSHAADRIAGHIDVDHLIFEREHFKSLAEGLKRTTTWRVGRLVLSPLSIVKRILRRAD